MAEGKQILALNRFEAGEAAGFDDRLAALIRRREATFGAASVLFYKQPLEIMSASGVWMHAADGRRYLDMYNNVASVGHCHPHVVAAIADQAGRLATNTRYLYDVVHTYAEKLLATFPAPLANVALTCTGSESNDLAMRIARAATGGEGFVVTETAYHGNTSAVTDVSPSSFKQRRVPRHVRVVPAPDVYVNETADVGARLAADVAAAAADLEASGIRFAGMLADSIFSSDGIYADPPGFLKPVVEAVHAAGGLFIADEVQPGFGRTGDALWGFARHGVVPDIVTMGKPMGNGFPMGGVVTSPDLMAVFAAETGYFNTFGGNPVAAAAGLAVMEVIEGENLLANARRIGALVRDRLKALGNRHPVIGDVRGAGLFVGLEFSEPGSRTPSPATATAVINGLKDEGVLIGAAGLYGNVLKIRPPLVFAEEHVDVFVDAIDRVLGRI
ncbi:aspartate aminotransferase family protein [Oharaeibacter diazotrophicus]|uniref:4-aminobutyrate aminotransferase-like enzyme n=1 Tax=Oharaeibacter diazotrophicus TaxID=1920512 RepID=A0A4R6RKP2_9HYPH|nr:aspartate aminotransferase family protein [Oharaeibacter diazotrophicus]TDP87189.1 4-aminobutyrate aminotransferase-like enzyme [Oharaeibacter diazotrophicus]BBE70868.1 4-aminobutyrate aminotransferase GabT [Pleomorphomonas sp. SM30]GLS77617.1 aminotransferase [Oharaeibacter diazotrophicus]